MLHISGEIEGHRSTDKRDHSQEPGRKQIEVKDDGRGSQEERWRKRKADTVLLGSSKGRPQKRERAQADHRAPGTPIGMLSVEQSGQWQKKPEYGGHTQK